jgi:hypothetical protein
MPSFANNPLTMTGITVRMSVTENDPNCPKTQLEGSGNAVAT